MNQGISGEPVIRSDQPSLRQNSHPETRVRFPGHWLAWARMAWLAIALLCIGLYLASIWPLFIALQTPCSGVTCLDWQLSLEQIHSLHDLGISLTFYATYFTILGLSVALIHGLIAAFIFWRKSTDWLALLGSLTLLVFGVASMNDIATAALVAISPVWRLPVSSLTVLGDIGLLIFFCLFPDGQFIPRWTRWLASGWIMFRIPAIFLPLSPFDTEIGPLTSLAWSFFLGGIVVAQLYRYRKVSNPAQRQQTKWIVFGITAAIGGFVGLVFGLPLFSPALLFDLSSPYTWAVVTAINVLWLLVPLSISMAILRYRLWDIDLIIHRTLVYSLLTASIIGLYVLLVGGLGALFQTAGRGSLLISLIATAVVAVLFAPLRDRLQRGVNRILYGQRDEPYAVLAHLGQRLEATLAPDAVLPTIVTTIKEALKLPYVAIALDQEGTCAMVAVVGVPALDPLCLPLSYQGEPIGQLILAPRSPGEVFTPAERQLLDDLAHQVGVAAAAVRLTVDLQHSRERLVTAREEERRRLRRDLHDGLGPALAAHTLKIGSARALLRRDLAAADGLLAELENDTQTTLNDIRRVVYNLRPPSLDELGLIGAIRESASNFGFSITDFGLSQRRNRPLGIQSKAEDPLKEIQNQPCLVIEAPERLPSLPAAVEVAAYRIIQEALTNIMRHAQARRCYIQLTLTEMLRLEINDDGVGLPPEYHPGVGLASMRERAQELGGTCQIETRPEGGVHILAQLPLSQLPLLGKEEVEGIGEK